MPNKNVWIHCEECGRNKLHCAKRLCRKCYHHQLNKEKGCRNTPCPKCGQPKKASAQQCRSCWLKARRKPLPVCIDCGVEIGRTSTRCKGCSNSAIAKERWEAGAFDERATEEYRQKLAETSRAAWARGDIGGEDYLQRKSESARAAHARGCYDGVFQSPTQPEKDVMACLEGAELAYEFQYRISAYRYDFFVPSLNTLIEYDGGYWHSLPKAKKRDRIKTRLAAEAGKRLVRIASPIPRNLSLEEINMALEEAGIFNA